MLDFRPKAGRTKNYYSRHEQRKLLLLVLSVGMVLFLIEQAANPRRWLWIWQVAGQQAAGNGNAQRHAKVEQPPGLHRNLGRAEFIAEGEHHDGVPAGKTFFPGVAPELLAKVRDDTVLRPSESEAFYHLLKILEESSEEDLAKATIGPVSFRQLFTQPKEFRGELVTVSGSARRVEEKLLPQNEYGIKRFYQVVIEPDDRDYPVVIDVLDLPKGFPQGKDLNETVRIHGFFYKRWAYLSEKKEIATWPLLMSKTVHWQPAPVVAPPADNKARLKGLTSGLALAVVASLAAIILLYLGTRRKTQFVMPQPNRAGLQRLADQDVAPDVREELAELARHEQQ